MSKKQPILVTGSHRSGSTWVGKMIARSPNVAYIHEPFNLQCRPGICEFQFEDWFTHINSNNAVAIEQAFQNTLCYKYNALAELLNSRSPRDGLRMVRDWYQCLRNRYADSRPLVKDPLALFSAESLAQTFDMKVIVLIRHPAAFASSLKVKGWNFPFGHLLNQPTLIQQHLSEYEASIQSYAIHKYDIVEQSILLWKMMHDTILKYRRLHPNWLFIRHEDISRKPIDEFSAIFNYLDLDFSEEIANVISQTSGADNPVETSANIHFVKRNSQQNIWNWCNRLTPDEISRIAQGVRGISEHFYSSEDWQVADLSETDTSMPPSRYTRLNRG